MTQGDPTAGEPGTLIRQGDVLLIPRQSLPDGPSQEIADSGGRLVLLEGEAGRGRSDPLQASKESPAAEVLPMWRQTVQTWRQEGRGPRLYRQGDVLLVEVGWEKARTCPELERTGRRLILAYGEATGHHHAVVSERAQLRSPEADSLISPEQAQELYLLVYGDEAVELSHEEHGTLLVEPGAYRVVRQREYQPSAVPRPVVD